MTTDFIENQYWPSKWSKRLPADVICAEHYSVVYKETMANKKSILSEENVQYGETPTELMDIYGQNLPTDAPWFIYLHGGYWIDYTKDSSAYCARPLWKAGVRVCVPDYDLAPKVTMEQIVNQVRTMAKYIFRRAAKENSRGIWICGHSAGAHLAARLLDEGWLKTLEPEEKDMFKGLYLISGIYDLGPILKIRELNDALKMTKYDAESQSPINTVGDFKSQSLLNEEFKIMIAVAEDDSEAFKIQSSNYCEKLNDVGMEAEYVVQPDTDHFNIVENLRLDTYILTQKIIEQIGKVKF